MGMDQVYLTSSSPLGCFFVENSIFSCLVKQPKCPSQWWRDRHLVRISSMEHHSWRRGILRSSTWYRWWGNQWERSSSRTTWGAQMSHSHWRVQIVEKLRPFHCGRNPWFSHCRHILGLELFVLVVFVVNFFVWCKKRTLNTKCRLEAHRNIIN